MRIEFLMEVLANRRSFYESMVEEANNKYHKYVKEENRDLARYYALREEEFDKFVNEYNFLIELFEKFNNGDSNE